MTTLPQQVTINQYEADGITDTYTYSYLILLNTDIAVYITPPATPANPTTDLQTLNTDYEVTGVGNENGGTVIFNSVPVQGSIITLSRDIQFEITTNFSNAQTISGVNLDLAFQRVVLMCQQLGSDYALRGLQYFINTVIPTNPENVATTVNLLPTLDANQIWMGTNTLNVTAVTLEENIDVSTFRSELANEDQNTDGARLIGYYDEYFNAPGTLSGFLNNLPAYIDDVVSGLIPATGFQTGDMKPSWNPTPLAGWILYEDGSIGSATSGATILASATTQALFTNYWDNYSDAECPVSGGRGGSAAADFAANKRLTLPLGDGRAFVNVSGGVYTAGEPFGEDEVTLTTNEMPTHHHDISFNTNESSPTPTANKIAFGISPDLSTFADITGTSGGGLPHENRQPSNACYWHIKL